VLRHLLGRDCGQQIKLVHPKGDVTNSLPATDAAVVSGAAWQRTILDEATEHEANHVSILFANVVGYSKCVVLQVPIFVERFLGVIADLLERATRPPLARNT
jgi:hypothetical protein